MSSEQIYESVLVEKCLSELKALRDHARRKQWYPESSGDIVPGLPDDLCDMASRGESEHEYIMWGSRSVLFNSIMQVVIRLLKEHQVEIEPVPSRTAKATIYLACDKAKPELEEEFRPAPALLIARGGIRTLYIFKRFGLDKRWPKAIVDILREQVRADEVRYVSLVDDRAYEEQFNRNEDEGDPTRGTGVYSLKQFFELFFPKDEYGVFREYFSKVTAMARGYFGYTVVKNLGLNAAHLFRKEVARELNAFAYERTTSRGKLSVEQRAYLDEQYFKRGASEALTGASDFASSFMTAEWLFQSLRDGRQVDLSPIVMDYYKSVEQFMFQFLGRHTNDIDGGSREVYVLKKKYLPLTSQEMLVENKSNITLSGLIGFFGHWNKRGCLERRNKDLLREGISEETYELINYALDEIPTDRNGYFHKDNLYTWEDVVNARSKTLFIFYLLLGAYRYSESDMKALDMKRDEGANGFNKLCDYLNDKAHEEAPSRQIPIFYINGDCKEEDALLAAANTNIVGYGEKYGTPLYMGAGFRRIEWPEEMLLLTSDEISAVHQGELVVDRMDPSKKSITGPKEKLYENGRFLPTD